MILDDPATRKSTVIAHVNVENPLYWHVVNKFKGKLN